MTHCHALRDAIRRHLTLSDPDWSFPDDSGDDWLLIARLDGNNQHLELVGDDDCTSIEVHLHIHPPLLNLRGPAERLYINTQQDIEDSADHICEFVQTVIDGSTVVHYYVRSGLIFFRDNGLPAWRSHPIVQRILGEIQILRWQGKSEK